MGELGGDEGGGVRRGDVRRYGERRERWEEMRGGGVKREGCEETWREERRDI